MKIAILGAGAAVESERLKEEAERRGHIADFLGYNQFTIIYQPKLKITIDGKDLAKEYDVLIPRGLTKHSEEALILSDYMKYNNKLVIDRRLADRQFFLGKHQTCYNFSKNQLPQPQTFYFFSRKQAISQLKKIKFPAIIKHILGKQSKNIYRIENLDEVKKYFKKYRPRYFIIQEFIPTDSYIRVFVIGNEVVGAIKRKKIHGIPKPGERASSGVKSSQISLTEKLKILALKAAQVEKNDICGVDFLEFQNIYYLIEANRSPMFKSFEKITGINVAEKIIKYIEGLWKAKNVKIFS